MLRVILKNYADKTENGSMGKTKIPSFKNIIA